MSRDDKWCQIIVLVPKTWLPLIDKERGDMPRTYWIRDLIRDALKDKGAWWD